MEKKKKIAVIFPGIGYHCDKPLLYYSKKIAQEYGYEKIISLSYCFNEANIRENKEKMQKAFESLYEQAEKSLEEITFSEYNEILFISKSIGTIIASAYVQKQNIKCNQVMYTPLEQTFQFKHEDAVAFIGTSDPWSYSKDVTTKAKIQGVKIYTYEDANHSLETQDSLKNIDILKDVMKKTCEYIKKKTE